MSLDQSIEEYVRAGFIGIWIKTHEQDEAIHEIKTTLCDRFQPQQNDDAEKDNEAWVWATWDAQNLLQGPESIMSTSAVVEQKNGFAQPGALFGKLPEIAEQSGNGVLLLVLKNWHRKEFADNTQLIQCIQNLVALGKGLNYFKFHLLFLAPTAKVPSDLEKHIVVIEHELPDKEALWEMAGEISEENGSILPDDPEEQMLIKESASGLTRYEAEGAFSLSIIRTRNDNKRIDPSIVWDIKAQTLKKRGLLEIYDGDASFDRMGGLAYFREFSDNLLRKRVSNPLLYPKGLLLLGVPGSGKTEAVRCLGRSTGRRVLHMRMGTLRSKFQGESDANMESALEIADAMAPCILFIDEVEKSLSGVGSGGQTDGGTGERMFGRLLEWQNDHQSDVFFACTCNQIDQIMDSNPEFCRAERFDGMFFFDMPTEAERKAIWNLYLPMFGFEQADYDMDDLIKLSDLWTGAEIKTCCRLSAITDEPLNVTADSVVPVARMADSSLTSLRRWAAGKCRSASRKGLFQYTEPSTRQVSGVKKKKGVRRKLRTQ